MNCSTLGKIFRFAECPICKTFNRVRSSGLGAAANADFLIAAGSYLVIATLIRLTKAIVVAGTDLRIGGWLWRHQIWWISEVEDL
jgi:hypothetical protein